MASRNVENIRFSCSIEPAFEGLDALPVVKLRESLRQELRDHTNFVLVGETGSGKTTCLPPLLLELRNELGLKGGIAVTQPRRVATRSATARVSEMMGTEVGEKVGYHIRFEDVTSPETDITFMTDGVLLRKIQFDPFLSEYSIVMVDEAHERSLNIDLCLGLLKEVNERRRSAGVDVIRIIVTSATIERNRFAEYIGLGDRNNSVEIEGKMFPVEVVYERSTPENYDFIRGAVDKVSAIIDNNIEGDILIFMPGKGEITSTIDKIKERVVSERVEIIPLHAELSPDDQDRIFSPSEYRKIIVSTNIAETSVTIDGVIHVIDPGLIKQIQFDTRSGIEQLVLTKHAQSGLEQRKGRAGRTAPGICYRLFTESSRGERPYFQTPEIQRSELTQVVLSMKKVGIHDIEGFDFIDHPGKGAIHQALKTLKLLGALDGNDEITEIGEWLVDLSLEPRLGRMVIEAARPDINCVNEITIIASFLDGKNIFLRPSERQEQMLADRAHAQFKRENESDFVVFLNVWKAYDKSGFDPEWAKQNFLNEKALEEAKNVRLDLIDVLSNHGIFIDPKTKPVINKDAIGKAVAAGLIGNLLQNTGKNQFRKVDGTKGEISIHPSSVYYNNVPGPGSFIVAGEIFISPSDRAFACNCMEIKPIWVKEIAPYLFFQGKKDQKKQNQESGTSHSRSRHKSRKNR
jgi:HrpA-like RNA helicase